MIPEEIARRERVHAIRETGTNPYPSDTKRTHHLNAVLASFDNLFASKESVTVSGRIRSLRKHGGLTFLTLEDASTQMQIVIRRDEIGTEAYELFHSQADIADFYQVTGTAFLTKKDEQSIDASDLRMLTKSLLPLPEKWHGLTDTEIRYRHRYLDLIANDSVFANAKKRSLMLRVMRTFLEEEGFTEVETPILQPIPGGAAARPFVTHHNSLHADFYLRIAPELYLKRLLVGGFEKVFEVARCFRNEGISPQHNPEFTQIEGYWAYATIEDLMDHIENMLKRVIDDVFDGQDILYRGESLSFETPLPRISFHDLMLSETGVDIDTVQTEAALIGEMKKLDVSTEGIIGYGELIDTLFKAKVRPNIVQPTFLTEYPSSMKPLAKRRENPFYSASAQLVISGLEVMNAFNEQNDPLEQEEQFDEQEALREQGSHEAQFIDRDYLKALKHGMPPAAGYGIGIDRIIAILTDSASLKEVILFPTLKPKTQEGESDDNAS
jgi:lysyl-tRNA synthetase, class II